MRDDALGMAGFEGGQHRLVGAGDRVRVVVEPADQPDDDLQLGGEAVEQAQQAAVAGDLADLAVEAVVGLDGAAASSRCAAA